MKMKKIGLLLLIACVSFFAACGDDDDDKKPADDYATAVAGTYNGELKIALGSDEGHQALPEKKDILISKAGENKINLALNNFTFGEMNVGDIKISDVEIKKSKENSYAVTSTTAKNVSLMGGNIIADITIASGTFADNKMSVKLEIAMLEESKIPVIPGGIFVIIDNATKK